MAEKEEFRSIVRISDKDVDGRLKLRHAMTKVKGVSWPLANAICSVLRLNKEQQVGAMLHDQISKVEEVMRNPTKYGIPAWLCNRRKDLETGADLHLISADLTLRHQFDIREMKKKRSYKGIRHALGLRVRGQRTRATGRKGSIVGVVRRKQMPAKKKK